MKKTRTGKKGAKIPPNYKERITENLKINHSNLSLEMSLAPSWEVAVNVHCSPMHKLATEYMHTASRQITRALILVQKACMFVKF